MPKNGAFCSFLTRLFKILGSEKLRCVAASAMMTHMDCGCTTERRQAQSISSRSPRCIFSCSSFAPAKSRRCSHLFHTTPPVLPVDPTGDHTKHFCHCKCAVWGWACARQHRRMRGLGISPLKRGTAPALQWRQKQPRHGPGGLTLMQQHLREARGHRQLFKVCCSTGTRIPCAARV